MAPVPKIAAMMPMKRIISTISVDGAVDEFTPVPKNEAGLGLGVGVGEVVALEVGWGSSVNVGYGPTGGRTKDAPSVGAILRSSTGLQVVHVIYSNHR